MAAVNGNTLGVILWTNRTPSQKVVVTLVTLLALFIITAAICHAAKVDPFKLPTALQWAKSNVGLTCFITISAACGLGVLWYLPVKKNLPPSLPPTSVRPMEISSTSQRVPTGSNKDLF